MRKHKLDSIGDELSKGEKMVTLSFVFNDEKVKVSSQTRDELLEPMREHAKKYGITETGYGEYALGAIGRYAVHMSEEFMSCFDEILLDVNGNIEDCKQELIKARATIRV
mgnify:CR=1 FL=1